MAKVTIEIYDTDKGSVGIKADSDSVEGQKPTSAEEVASDILAAVKTIMDTYGGWPMGIFAQGSMPEAEALPTLSVVPNDPDETKH